VSPGIEGQEGNTVTFVATAAFCFAFITAICGFALRPFQKLRAASSGLLGMASFALITGMYLFWQYG
jgi:hypothetical protein